MQWATLIRRIGTVMCLFEKYIVLRLKHIHRIIRSFTVKKKMKNESLNKQFPMAQKLLYFGNPVAFYECMMIFLFRVIRYRRNSTRNRTLIKYVGGVVWCEERVYRLTYYLSFLRYYTSIAHFRYNISISAHTLALTFRKT